MKVSKSLRPIYPVIAFLIVLPLGLVQNAMADANSTDSNGLYYISRSATGKTIKSDIGLRINLAGKAEIQIRHARVFSLNNANTYFGVDLDTSDYPLDPKSGDMTKPVVLRVGDRAYSVSGWGRTAGSDYLISFNIEGLEEAKTAAKTLSTDCILRRPPGYKLFTQFVPVQSEFKTNQPVLVKFTVQNLDDRPIAFRRDGQEQGARDNQYGFRAMLYNHPAADTGNPLHMGGLFTGADIEPGKAFEDEIDLKKWFSFDKAGVYYIHGFFRMAFFHPERADDALMSWNLIWEDYVSADFQIVIK